MIATVIALIMTFCLAIVVEAATPKLSPEKAIQSLAENYAFGTDENSAAEKFLMTTLKDYTLSTATASQIKSAYAAKLQSIMNITTTLKKNDREHPVVTITVTTLDPTIAGNNSNLTALKVNSRMGSSENDSSYQNFILQSVSSFINEMPLSSRKSFDVVCEAVEGDDGDLYWITEDPIAFNEALVPTFSISFTNQEIDSFLGGLGGLGGGFNVGENDSFFADTYSPNDTWLIYLYVCGSNLESGDEESSGGNATRDLIEIQNAQLSPNVNILLQTGGADIWQNDIIKNGGVYLHNAAQPWASVGTLSNPDMGSAETLETFLRIGKEISDVDHRVFIFWDHGGGSAVGLCNDDTTGNALSLNEVHQAFSKVYGSSNSNPPFELIGFDTCLMSTYETANAIDGFASYMAASQDVEPGVGWYYTEWLNQLSNNPAMNGAKLGKNICDSYLKGCEAVNAHKKVTLSVLNLSNFSELKKAYESFGLEALERSKSNSRSFFTSLDTGARQAEQYSWNMVDLKDFADKSNSILPETSNDLSRAIDNTVIYKIKGPYRSNRSYGISTFYPYAVYVVPSTGRADIVEYLSQSSAPEPQKQLYYQLFRDHPDIVMNSESETSNENKGSKNESTNKLFDSSIIANTKINIDSQGNAFVKLTPEQIENISAVRCLLVRVDEQEEVALILGDDSDVKVDLANGIFQDNFRGVWPMLDGHPILINVTSEEPGDEGFIIYETPVNLNGVDCTLEFAYNKARKEYEIIGTTGGVFEGKGKNKYGMSNRELVNLKPGDKIKAIHLVAISDENDETKVRFERIESELFTIGENPTIKDEKLGDGTYIYLFQFIVPTGATVNSQPIKFTLNDNKIVTSHVDEEVSVNTEE